MKATAGPLSKPVCEIRNQSAAASSNSQRWRIFAIRWAVFSPLSSKTAQGQRGLHGNNRPRSPGTRDALTIVGSATSWDR
jgi:hypothetical protein